MDYNMIVEAIYTTAGLSTLIVFVTQILKNTWNKTGKVWLSHLFSFISSLVCNAAVLAVGLIWGIGIYAGFDVQSVNDWAYIIASTFGCTLIANGMWSYQIMKDILAWVKLMPNPTKSKQIFD